MVSAQYANLVAFARFVNLDVLGHVVLTASFPPATQATVFLPETLVIFVLPVTLVVFFRSATLVTVVSFRSLIHLAVYPDALRHPHR
jgi:hypothetical protein